MEVVSCVTVIHTILQVLNYVHFHTSGVYFIVISEE